MEKYNRDALRRSAEVVNEDVPETVEQSLATLRDEGLIEWRGDYRDGRRVWILTEKGLALRESGLLGE